MTTGPDDTTADDVAVGGIQLLDDAENGIEVNTDEKVEAEEIEAEEAEAEEVEAEEAEAEDIKVNDTKVEVTKPEDDEEKVVIGDRLILETVWVSVVDSVQVKIELAWLQ
ncbi:hypothetical protein BC938DRAFT_473459 [Jimgerdemannia flammicorona]|uniref:Uncharacterized protein n=1 Tax=Jimgerdemannia flammicorona TaxID=994334 RepID=A0A433QTF0_9FUNG|nr:hypothetical protein BC938DRAFT_473459 [Jimgerdemannia flammicorona]